MRAAVASVLALALACDGSGRRPTPSNVAAPPPADAAPSGAHRSCYPYLPAADGSCPTSCQTRDECAGSRGPADFAENGWPLDCIGGECVPLPPAHVHPP